MIHPIDTILPRLHGVKPSGTGFVARCPGHNDRNPSLSVKQAENGRLLLYCHAGCPPEAIVDALGLQMKDLFAESTLQSGSINGKRRREVAATYDYTDEDGELLFQVVRYNWSKDLTKPKDFRQRRPDGKGGWIYSLGDTRRLPYRLPEVVTSSSVIVVEGEKDADALEQLGLIAPTTAGGAGKFTDDYTPYFRDKYFRDKSVAILPDHDAPGKRHARHVARLLLPVARRVRIVELAGLPPKGDVSDWINGKESKQTKADLLAAIKQTPPLTSADVDAWVDEQAVSETHSTGFSLTPLASLLAEEPETTPWLWENILPRGGLGLLCAKPKIGKSTLARNLALRVARGEEFLSRATEKGPVVYLALEEKRGEVQSHFNRLGGQEEEIHVHIGPAPVEEPLQALRAAVTESKAVLPIVDPLFRLVRVKDGNDYNPMTLALEPLMTIARDTGAGFLTKREAKQAATARAAALRRRTSSKPGYVSFREVLASYVAETERYKTREWRGQQIAKLNRVFGHLCDKPCQRLADDPSLIKAAIEAHADRVKPSTLNEYRKLIRAVFGYAVLKEYCDRNPVVQIPKWPEQSPQRVVATEPEISGLLDHGDTDLVDLLSCQLHSLARLADLRRLKWEDTDFKRRVLILRTRKRRGGEGEWPVPINNPLYQVLSRRRLRSTGPYVFPQYSRRRWYQLLEEARKRAGLERSVGFHAIRHAQARLLADSGIPINAIQALLGHKSLAATYRYVQALVHVVRTATSMLEKKTAHGTRTQRKQRKKREAG